MELIYKEQSSVRLDVFLTEKLNAARNQVQKTIKAGTVFVNGKQEKANCVLKFGDEILIKESESLQSGTAAQLSAAEPRKPIPVPKVLAETPDYLVIEKPAGLLAHTTTTKHQPSLVDWLVENYPEVSKIADADALIREDITYRPGIVHRLDKDVSGLMLIARNQDAFDFFKLQFKQKKIRKEYVALIHGQLERPDGEIDFEISRKSTGEKMAAHPKGSGKGKPSITQYETIQKFVNFTLLRTMPITGRTNQIRVHLFAIDHPIVGDRRYSNQRELTQNTKLNIQRPFLHAAKLTFTDREGNKKTFESAIPEELTAILKKAK